MQPKPPVVFPWFHWPPGCMHRYRTHEDKVYVEFRPDAGMRSMIYRTADRAPHTFSWGVEWFKNDYFTRN